MQPHPFAKHPIISLAAYDEAPHLSTSSRHYIYKRAAARPTAIKRPPADLAPAPPVKGTVLLEGGLGMVPVDRIGPAGVLVGVTGVTVMTEVT